MDETKSNSHRAHVEHDFDIGFLLGEEAIVRIRDLIGKRLGEFQIRAPVQLKVTRADGLVYETTNTADVCEEENGRRNAIRIVKFSVASKELNLSLTFSKEDDTNLAIDAHDKNHALLLVSDLREYLTTEVLVLKSWDVATLTAASIIAIGTFGIFLTSIVELLASHSSGPTAADALRSQELLVKLDYLIAREQSKYVLERTDVSLVVPILAAVFTVLTVSVVFMRVMYPRNIFLIGKMVQRYTNLLETRSKWIWGIGVSSVVGIVTSLVVWVMTK